MRFLNHPQIRNIQKLFQSSHQLRTSFVWLQLLCCHIAIEAFQIRFLDSLDVLDEEASWIDRSVEGEEVGHPVTHKTEGVESIVS